MNSGLAMKMLLNGMEAGEFYSDIWETYELDGLLTAQVAKIIKWLDASCNKHPYNPNDYGISSAPMTTYESGDFYSHRKDCPCCWHELKETND